MPGWASSWWARATMPSKGSKPVTLPPAQSRGKKLDRHGGANLSPQCANDQVGGFPAAFAEVDVGIGVAGDDDIGKLGHRVADVGVQVESDDDRAVGSEDGADAAQKIAFAVVDALDDHGAVQVQQRTVDRHGGFEVAPGTRP